MLRWLLSLFRRRRPVGLWDSLAHHQRWLDTRGVDLPTSGTRRWL